MKDSQRGATLLELALILSILGLVLGLSYSPLRHGIDGVQARGARDLLGMGVARARSTAVARGGASLVVDLGSSRFWVETAAGDTVGDPTDLSRRYGVDISTDGSTTEVVVLHFDALGIGRVTNRTFHLQRGSAEAHLTLSSYGRPRPW